jgi:undecaprenyl-diphosphatase
MAQLSILQSVVLGIVEGITEYLPISSTGHLIIASGIMGLDSPPERKAAVDAFNIVIQGGAILAVLGLYWPHVVRMLRGLIGKDGRGFALLINLFVAFLPAAAVGVVFNKVIEAKLFHTGPVLFSIIAGGVYMLIIDARARGKWASPKFAGGTPRSVYDVTIPQAFFIGCMQIIAMWPGTSRSMMTITGGMLSGLRARQAAEFSFLLGLPTLAAATIFKLYKDFSASSKAAAAGIPHTGMFDQLGVVPCLVGIGVATISAGIAVAWLVGFLNRRGLAPFGWYRIALGVLLLLLVNSGTVRISHEAPAGPSIQNQTTTVPPVDFSPTERAR